MPPRSPSRSPSSSRSATPVMPSSSGTPSIPVLRLDSSGNPINDPSQGFASLVRDHGFLGKNMYELMRLNKLIPTERVESYEVPGVRDTDIVVPSNRDPQIILSELYPDAILTFIPRKEERYCDAYYELLCAQNCPWNEDNFTAANVFDIITGTEAERAAQSRARFEYNGTQFSHYGYIRHSKQKDTSKYTVTTNGNTVKHDYDDKDVYTFFTSANRLRANDINKKKQEHFKAIAESLSKEPLKSNRPVDIRW